METTELTIRLPRDLLEGGKRYAHEHDTTLTWLVSGYLRQLSTQGDTLADALAAHRLEELAQKEDACPRAQEWHLQRLKQDADLGTGGQISIQRDELHERI